MKLRLFILLIPFTILLAQAQLSLNIDNPSPQKVEEIITISYGITNPTQLEGTLNHIHNYLLQHPENRELNALYQQRVQHYTTATQLTDCVDQEAQEFASRVLDDSITIAPCSSCENLEPLDLQFTQFIEQFIEINKSDSHALIQNKFIEFGVASAAENLAQIEYLTNPEANAKSIFNKICGEQNTNPIINFVTRKKHYTQCSDEMAPAIRASIQNKINSLAGQPRYRLPDDNQKILQKLISIVNELNATLKPVTASIRPLTDLRGNLSSHHLQTFGPKVALQLDRNSAANYQKFLQLFYEKTSSGIGTLLLSSKIMSHLPSIKIDNGTLGFKSHFIDSGEKNRWGDNLYRLPALPLPDDSTNLKSDITNTILDSAQELKSLEGEKLSPKKIGKYVAVNPLNLAKVLKHYPELTDEACEYINYAQNYSSRRENIDSKLQAASRWIGVGGAALSMIAGPLGAVPACIIGATAGSIATITSGAVLLRKMDHLKDLQDAYATGGGDVYSIQEIINSYQQVNAQVVETLVELGFTIFDFVQLGKALHLTKSVDFTQGVEDILNVAKKHGIKTKENLIEFTKYIKKVEGSNFTHFTDLSDEIADAFGDIHRVSDDIRVRRINEAEKFHDSWKHVELDQAIEKFAGEHPIITTTDSGKILYTNSDTGVRVVHDYYGDYIRIENPNLTGKRRYLNLDGDIPNNSVTPQGKTIGNNNAAYNGLTHFWL